MSLHARRLPWLLLALAILAAVFLRPRESPAAKGDSKRKPSASETFGKGTRKSPGTSVSRTDPSTAIAAAASGLRDAGTADDRAAILAQLAATLDADPEKSSNAIRAYLATGEDAATGLPFAVGSEGRLDSWPSLRAFLLEILPTLDPEAALALSRGIMDRMDSPDEYLIALRNLAWSDLDGDIAPEFGQRFERLLRETRWREQPGPAFLEAMDAALLLPPARGAELLMETCAASATPPSLSRACFIALDRIAGRDPALLVNLDVSRLIPDQRASLLSRLDITDAAQRTRFTDYLAALPEGAELDYFSSLFPNGNHLQGNRFLSTPIRPPSIAQRRESDRRTLAELSAIRFPPGSPAAAAHTRICERLTGWLAAPE
jgi:hypothetical protein